MSNKLSINEWIKQIFQNDTIPEDIIAMNFGFFESSNGNAVYCIGSSEYDEEDPDWACNEDFIPTEKYFTPEESISSLDWMKFDSTMCDIIKTVLDNCTDSIPSSVSNICCGFDDGDLTVVWSR